MYLSQAALPLQTSMSSSFCAVCDVKLPSPNHANLHYISKKHVSKYLQMQNGNQNGTPPAVDNRYQIPAVFQCPVKRPAIPEVPVELINCFLCRGNILRSEKEKHILGFPHCDLAQTKSALIRAGIWSEFYSVKNENRIRVACNLCNLEIYESSTLKSHFMGKGHMKKFASWCSLQTRTVMPGVLLESALKESPYYCNVCHVDLDGTSDARSHYVGAAHQALHSKLPVSPLLNVSNDSPMAFSTQEPVASANVVPDPSEPVSSKRRKKQKNKSSTSTANNHIECPQLSLKNQIFNEIEKLVQTVYYSNKLPHIVAVQCLQKFNREVEVLVKTYKKPQELAEKSPSINENESVNSVKCDKYVTGQDDLNLMIESKDQSFKIVEQQGKRVLQASTSSFSEEDGDVQPTKPSLEPPTLPVDKQPNKNTAEKPKNIHEMLLKVTSEKSNLEHAYPYNYATFCEIELLTELQWLLNQIEQPDVPLKPILEYLEKFNAELNQKQGLMEVSEGSGLNDEEGWQ